MINTVGHLSTGGIACGILRRLQREGGAGTLYFGRGPAPEGVVGMRFIGQTDVTLHAARARLTDRQGFYSRRATERLVEALEREDADVIHLHNLHGYYLDTETLFAYLAASRKPVVWTLHDCHAFTGHCAYFSAVGCDRWQFGCGNCPQKGAYPQSLLMDQSKRNLAQKKRLYDAVENLTLVTPSRWLANLLPRSILADRPVQVLPNGIDLDTFCPTESDLRARFGLGGAPVVLGAAGVWDRRKGLDTFVRLRALLPSDVRMVLIGLTERQIRSLPTGILGLQRTADVHEMAAWYTASDVFCNPSEEDNFPTTHLEALACGTPVVTTDVCGCAEALDAECGIAVKLGDDAATAGALMKAMSFSAASCRRQAAAYGRDVRLNRYIELYRALCGEGKG